MNGRFCGEAWDAVSRYVYTALQGGSIMKGWTNDNRMMITCCNDGTRPVIFKIERIDIPETPEEEDWLAKPSTVTDWILEAARVLPSKISSSLHHMRTSEELGIRTEYRLPQMSDVRRIVRQEIPGARIHYALHYRYLLEWTSE